MSHWPESSNIKIMSNMQPIKCNYGGWNDKTPNLQVLRHSSESSQPPDRGEVKFVSAGRMARQPRHNTNMSSITKVDTELDFDQ